MPRHLIIDCETVAIDKVQDYLEPVFAPDNYKSAEAIERYVTDARKKAIERAALDIDLARIVCIGWEYHEPQIGISSGCYIFRDEVQERTGLGEFWQRFWPVYVPGSTVAVTFNGLGYDLPLLLRRSLYLGVTAPKLQLDRYRHPDVVDLMQLLCLDGRLRMHSLSFYANRFGLPYPQEIDGSHIAAAVAAGEWEAVKEKCQFDVATTKALAVRMGVL